MMPHDLFCNYINYPLSLSKIVVTNRMLRKADMICKNEDTYILRMDVHGGPLEEQTRVTRGVPGKECKKTHFYCVLSLAG